MQVRRCVLAVPTALPGPMAHAVPVMVARSRTATTQHASHVRLDGPVMQGYAASARQGQSLRKDS